MPTEIGQIAIGKAKGKLISDFKQLAEIRAKNGIVYVLKLKLTFNAFDFCKAATAEQIIMLIEERQLFAIDPSETTILPT